MSKHLAALLEQPEKSLAKVVNQLEAKNSYPSHDVRLSAETIQRVRTKLQQLGLDPDDTTAEELHQALLVRFENDTRRFDEHFSAHAKDYDEKSHLAAELIAKNIILPDRWVIKNSAAKALLRQHPPKRLMKQLHYRSLESFIKREDLAEVYLGVEFIESAAWNKTHFKLASQLDTTAFERRQLKLASLPAARWGFHETGQKTAYSGDYGVLGFVPSKELAGASLLCLLIELTDQLNAPLSEAVTLSPTVAWWSDTDRLIANLAGGQVSLNLKDTAENQLTGGDFQNRAKAAGQQSFWKELLSRYENQLAIEEDLLPHFELPQISLQIPVNQPAFEYVEDI